MLFSNASLSQTLDFTGYQNSDGAITLRYQGNYVDPYFAIKGLLLAHDNGFDVNQQANSWIGWSLAHQQADGKFGRYSQQPDQRWQLCAEADADDALLAMWLELLYDFAPPAGFPPAWQNSAARAQRQLARLYMPNLGIYKISLKKSTGLFMDNVEIYAAFTTISRQLKLAGNFAGAAANLKQANELRLHILKVFRPSGTGPFRVSTQAEQAARFYPEQVAQLYPLMNNMAVSGDNPKIRFENWFNAHGAGWINLTQDHYPWGLVALAALKVGDQDAAWCWLQHAEPFRYSDRWNLLEEMAYQIITRSGQAPAIPCH